MSETSLWPDDFANRFPIANTNYPLEILREQGRELSRLTNDKLYGEVLESEIPTSNGVTYNFSICVTHKPYRYVLFTVTVGYFASWEVTIYNTVEDVHIPIHSEESFREQLRLIFGSALTQQLIGRMWSLAEIK